MKIEPQVMRLHRSVKSSPVLLFLLGLGSLLQVNIIGYISLTEIYFLVAVPLVYARDIFKREQKMIRGFVVLWLIWLAATVCTDLVLGVEAQLMYRGIAKVFFLGICIIAFDTLFGRSITDIRWFLGGAAVSVVLSNYILRPGSLKNTEILNLADGDIQSVYNYWITAGWAFVLAVYYRRTALWCGFGTVILGVLYVLGGSRSAGLIMMCAGVAMARLGPMLASNRNGVTVGMLYSILGYSALGGGLAAGVYFGAAKSGLLSERNYAKYELQTTSRLGILLGGRPEALAAALAICDSPLVGRGSWPEDLAGYRIRSLQMVGYSVPNSLLNSQERSYIPSHSMILGAWVEQGIPGLLFWLFVIFQFYRGFLPAIRFVPEMAGYICFILAYYAWAFFFSPAGFRVPLAANLGLMFAVSRLAHSREITRRSMMRVSGYPD